MSRNLLRRAFLVIPLALATLAGCKDTEATAPVLGSNPLLAQGDGGVWTVNKLEDPGDGVCDDTHCTLREAIAAAASGHEITFANGLQGDIQLTSSTLFVRKSLSINGDGRIAIDGQDHLVMSISGASPITVTLEGLTLKNGGASSVPGGGIRIGEDASATVTIRNSTITGTSMPSDGAGVFMWGGSSLTLMNSAVVGNSAGGHGGGIHNGGILTIQNSTIDGNSAATFGSNGGGIHNSGTLVITGSTISNNQAFDGGGIYNTATGSASLHRVTISGNSAQTEAVPAFLGGGIHSRGTLSLVSTTIAKNQGEGILLRGGTSTVANSLIAGGCTIAQGTQTSLGHNLSDQPGCLFDQSSDVLVGFGTAFTNVLEPELRDNGGPTRTHALIARGHAVDAGRCPAETTDQRGFARPIDDPTVPNVNDACDIGAYEAQGPQVAVADLMVSQSVDKSSVKQGELLTYTVRVQNLGPQAAPNVVLNNVLSSGVTFVEARQNQGTITAPPRGETGTVTWNLGDMANQANEAAEIVVTVLVRGRTTITNTASVTGNVSDPNPANNSASITVTVVAGKAGKPRG
jgi:uncharacterized repeat protein (TIGR01451 family)/CSLREA domain-containing protein